MDKLAVNVDFEIADEILWARWYKKEVDSAEEALDKVSDFAAADGRTREGRAYKKARKHWESVLQDYQHTLMRLGRCVMQSELTDKALQDYFHAVMEGRRG